MANFVPILLSNYNFVFLKFKKSCVTYNAGYYHISKRIKDKMNSNFHQNDSVVSMQSLLQNHYDIIQSPNHVFCAI